MSTKNEYVIIRDDLQIDPVTVITEGLLVGRLLECEVLLNHPSVSRAHAGIKQIDDSYYLFPLRPNNPVTLNGKEVEGNEALAMGDIIGVGPFRLTVEDTEETLVIRVSLQFGMTVDDLEIVSASLTTDQLQAPTEGKKPPKPRAAPVARTKALDIFWDKRIREAGKMIRPSPLFPKTNRRSGKAQFNWMATTDLGSRWSPAIFIWATLIVGGLSVGAAYAYTRVYLPRPLSRHHTSATMVMTPPIAVKANMGACTGCHGWKTQIDSKCGQCHQSEAFVATVTKAHADAGIGCIDCHSEHKGFDFGIATAALATCTSCHNDGNKQTYRGKGVGTPHNGTLGYPVVDGAWSQRAVNDEEWELKQIPITRLPTDDDEKWKSKQFHALHSERVYVVEGIQGNALGQLSCSSCHRSFNPIDRETPRTTCGICHNGLTETRTNRVLIANTQPNCTSCHVQHIRDKRTWGTKFLKIDQAGL